MPRRAIQDGTEGVVKAQILIKNGVVQEVTILSGPRVFHAAVKSAIAQYKCVADGPEVLATGGGTSGGGTKGGGGACTLGSSLGGSTFLGGGGGGGGGIITS